VSTVPSSEGTELRERPLGEIARDLTRDVTMLVGRTRKKRLNVEMEKKRKSLEKIMKSID